MDLTNDDNFEGCAATSSAAFKGRCSEQPKSPPLHVSSRDESSVPSGDDDIEHKVNLSPVCTAPPNFRHIHEVQESAVNEREWHIARLSKESKKACFALQAITRRKCTTLIVKDKKATAAPTYVGMMDNYKKTRLERHQFFFCNDDINRCVKGSRR